MMFGLKTKRCLLCHAVQQEKVCSGCLNDLRVLFSNAAEVCPKCAEFSMGGRICGDCQNNPPPYSRLWACVEYKPPISGLLHAWKHLGQRELGEVVTLLLRENLPPWLREAAIDAVLPMPVSRERRLQRGFNQCDILADAITRHYNLPVLHHNSVFRQPKPPQSTLNAQQRAQNIRQAFRVDCDVKNRKVLIIDDVMTTGASISELAHTLLASGAAEVSACVVARNK